MLLLFCVLSGCGKSGELQKNSIEVNEKGWIKAAVHEEFDKEYYDKKELQENAETAIREYNDLAGEERIQLDSLTADDKTAHATITYAGDEDYEAFNRVGIYNGPVTEVDVTIYDVRTELFDRDGTKIPLQNLLVAKDDCNLVILSETCALKTSGKIRYASGNVELTGKKTAEVTADQKTYAYVVYE